MADFGTLSLGEMRKGLDAGEFTSVELVTHFLDISKKEGEKYNVYLELFDDALEQAKEADKRIQEGKSEALTGIPVALKDNILVHGKRVSAASKMLENYVASYDAFVIEKLKAQGAIFLGRTNMDEFAMGSSTEHSAFGDTKNPHDETRVPGGSSGGSAAAVALGGAPLALGSDTAGSVRQPAAFCGVVGLKPTYGSVSRSGLIAMGSSLDVIGPIGRTVSDVETVFEAIKGKDPKDSTTIDESLYNVEAPKKTMTIGVPRDLLKEGVSSDVLEHFDTTLKALEKEGHTIKDISLPYIKYSLPVYYIIMPAEVSTNLSRLDGIRYGLHTAGDDLLADYNKSRRDGFGPETRRRILVGAYVLSSGYYDAFYGKATTVRKMIENDFAKVFEGCDAIATPTAPTPPFQIGEVTDPVEMYLADVFTVPANITGIPALSIPMGSVSRNGKELPTGFQLMAPHLHEQTLFELGKQIEQNT